MTTGFPNLRKLATSSWFPTARLPSATSASASGGTPAPVRLHGRGLREPQRPWTWKQLLKKPTVTLLRPTLGHEIGRTKQPTAEQRYQQRQNGVDLALPKPAPTTRNLIASRPAPPKSGGANRYQPECLHLQWRANNHSDRQPPMTPSTDMPSNVCLSPRAATPPGSKVLPCTPLRAACHCMRGRNVLQTHIDEHYTSRITNESRARNPNVNTLR